MRYLSVCSGIEAATMAWHGLGWHPVAFSEIEPFPAAVLAHHYPDVPNLGDMTKFQEWPDYAIDLLVGGTPCQSFSVAGLRKGLDDPRGNLALTYLAIADRYRPKWLVWENVPGVLSSSGGRDFGAFLGALGQLGYGFAYRVLDAQYVRTCEFSRAVPQRRRRVFVVGYLGDWRRAAAVLFDGESLRGNPPPRRKAGEGASRGFECGPQGGGLTDVAPTLDTRCKDGPIRNQLGAGVIAAECAGTMKACKDSGGWSNSADHAAAGYMVAQPVAPTLNAHFGEKMGLENQHINQGGVCSLPPVANPLTARMHKGINTTQAEGQTLIANGGVFDVAHSLKGEGFDASEDGTGRGTPIVPICVTQDSTPNVTVGYSPSLKVGTGLDIGQPPAIAIQERAVSENPDNGPDGAGVRSDGASYTLEARTTTQAVAFDTTQITSPGNYSSPKNGDPCHPLSAGAHPPAVAFAQNQRGELRTSEIAPQLTTGGGKPGEGYPAVAFDMRGRDGGAMPEGPHDTANIRAADGGSSRSYVAAPWAVRRLTPVECERLQAFPDNFTRIPYRGKPADKCPDGPRYKALGNSMAVNVMQHIGQRIDFVEKLLATNT